MWRGRGWWECLCCETKGADNHHQYRLKTKKRPMSSSVAALKCWAWTKPETPKRVIEKNIGDCTRWVGPPCYDDVVPPLSCDNGSRIPPHCDNGSCIPPPCDNDNGNNNNNGHGYGSVSNETEEGVGCYTSCCGKSTKIPDYGGDTAAYFHMDTFHSSVNRKGLSTAVVVDKSTGGDDASRESKCGRTLDGRSTSQGNEMMVL